MIQPLRHRILIKPDDQPETEDSGLILLPQDRDYVPSSGTVVALGPGGSKVRYDARQRAIEDIVRWLQRKDYGRLAAGITEAFAGSADYEREIAIGDRVAFDTDSGVQLVADGVTYLVLNEDDVVVLLRDEVAA